MDSQTNSLAGNDSQRGRRRARVYSDNAAIWDDATTETFIRACATQVTAGNRPNSHFNKVGWENIVKDFQKETGNNYDRSQLKNKLDKLKSAWRAWLKLIGQTGIGFEPNGAVDQTDAWWQNYLKIDNRDVKIYRDGPPLLLQDQELLFNDIVYTENSVIYPTLGQVHSDFLDDENEMDLEDREEQQDFGESEMPSHATENQNTGISYTGQSSSSAELQKSTGKAKKRTRANPTTRLAVVVEKMAENVGPERERILGDREKQDIAQCLKILERCSGVHRGDGLYIFAMRLFLKSCNRYLWETTVDDET